MIKVSCHLKNETEQQTAADAKTKIVRAKRLIINPPEQFN
jgi:hypothetical protein